MSGSNELHSDGCSPGQTVSNGFLEHVPEDKVVTLIKKSTRAKGELVREMVPSGSGFHELTINVLQGSDACQ